MGIICWPSNLIAKQTYLRYQVHCTYFHTSVQCSLQRMRSRNLYHRTYKSRRVDRDMTSSGQLSGSHTCLPRSPWDRYSKSQNHPYGMFRHYCMETSRRNYPLQESHTCLPKSLMDNRRNSQSHMKYRRHHLDTETGYNSLLWRMFHKPFPCNRSCIDS